MQYRSPINFENGVNFCPKVCNKLESDSHSLSSMLLNMGGNLSRLKAENDPIFKYIFTESPDFIFLTETMCLNSLKIPEIKGYKYFFTRANPTGGRPSGGILIYFKKELDFKIRMVITVVYYL